MTVKKLLLSSLTCALATAVMTSHANAADCATKTYMALRGDYSMLKNHIDKNTWGASLAVGMDMRPMRAELEYNYNDEIKGVYAGERIKLGTQSLLINGYYDFHNGSGMVPFINLTAGASRLHEKGQINSKNEYRAAWGGGAGIAYHINDTAAIDLGYRFVSLGENVKNNKFYAGLRFSF